MSVGASLTSKPLRSAARVPSREETRGALAFPKAETGPLLRHRRLHEAAAALDRQLVAYTMVLARLERLDERMSRIDGLITRGIRAAPKEGTVNHRGDERPRRGRTPGKNLYRGTYSPAKASKQGLDNPATLALDARTESNDVLSAGGRRVDAWQLLRSGPLLRIQTVGRSRSRGPLALRRSIRPSSRRLTQLVRRSRTVVAVSWRPRAATGPCARRTRSAPGTIPGVRVASGAVPDSDHNPVHRDRHSRGSPGLAPRAGAPRHGGRRSPRPRHPLLRGEGTSRLDQVRLARQGARAPHRLSVGALSLRRSVPVPPPDCD